MLPLKSVSPQEIHIYNSYIICLGFKFIEIIICPPSRSLNSLFWISNGSLNDFHWTQMLQDIFMGMNNLQESHTGGNPCYVTKLQVR